jgi:hypothetical protein
MSDIPEPLTPPARPLPDWDSLRLRLIAAAVLVLGKTPAEAESRADEIIASMRVN